MLLMKAMQEAVCLAYQILSAAFDECQLEFSAKPEQLLKIAMPLQVNNIRLGIPVRLIRKNRDKGSEFGCVYIYDGLYNVVRASAGILPP